MALADRLRRAGGVEVYDLFELSVSRPAARTWFLAKSDVSVGGQQYLGVVRRSNGSTVASAIGGRSRGGSVTLEIDNTAGSFGSGGGAVRRFSDWFVEPTIHGEPYDLASATLTVKLAAREVDGSFSVATVGTFRLEPARTKIEGELLSLSFSEDRDLFKALPRRKVTKELFPHTPTQSIGRPIPLVFGRSQVVPGIPVHESEGRYVFCESPADTPVSIVSLAKVHQDPDTGSDKLFRLLRPATDTPIASWNEDSTGTETVVQLDSRATASTGSATASSISWSHTASGAKRLLVVAVAIRKFEPNPLRSVSSVSYNGKALTKLTAINISNGKGRAELWYLKQPDLGTHTVKVTLDGAGVAACVSSSWTGVDQTTPLSGTATARGTSVTSGSVTVSSATNRAVVDCLCRIHSGNQPSPGSGQTLIGLLATSNSQDNTWCGSSRKPGASSVAMSWSWNSADDFALIAASINNITTPATTEWVTLAEHGEVLTVDGGFFADRVALMLRRKAGDPAPAGELTVRLERVRDGLPSGDLVDPNAVATVPAANVTTAANFLSIEFKPPLPFVPPGDVAVTIRYAKTASAGNIELRRSINGGYDRGYAVEKQTQSNSEWLKTLDRRHARVESGLKIDGVVTSQPYKGKRVFDHLFLSGARVLVAGALKDKTGTVVAARGFFRFLIDKLDASATEAKLRLFLADRNGAVGRLFLEEVSDFGTLDAGDYDGTVITDFGEIANPDSDTQSYIEIDVTSAFNAAKTASRTAMAFRLRSEDEALTDGRHYYAVASYEQGSDVAPRLKVGYGTGKDLHFQLFAVEYTQTDSSADEVAEVTMARPLGEGVSLAAVVDGCRDTDAGDYTGAAAALIENGADIVRFLGLHPRALGLDTSRVATNDGTFTSLSAARLRLADWFPLAGVIDETRDGDEWLSEVAKAAKAIVFVGRDGKLRMFVDGDEPAPVLRLRPWDYGRVSLSASEDGLPLSRVLVFHGRDLLSLPNTGGSRSEEAGWDGLALISADETSPPDDERKAKAQERKARYGERENDDQHFAFVPLDDFSTAPAERIRDWIFDRADGLVGALDSIDVELPRLGAVLELHDTVIVEAYSFPVEGGSVPLGLMVVTDSEVDDGTSDLYAARAALVSVRELSIDIESGGEWPVKLRGKIVRWMN